MRLLPTFFPKHARPRTVVHAGRLVLKRPDGPGLLRRYLRRPRRRELFLVHKGQEPLRDAALDAGVTDIALDAPARDEANATAELALALGARRLDFSIDEPGVPGPDGEALERVSLSEAEALVRDPQLRPRIRAKLRAGCEALRQGVKRVRIGDPGALATDRATELVPDSAIPLAEPSSLRDPWWRLRASRAPAAAAQPEAV